MPRIEDFLIEAQRVNEQVAVAKQAQVELIRQRHRDIEQFGDNAVSQTGFSRDDVVPRVQATISRTLELANKAGFARIPSPSNPSDRDINQFGVHSNPVLINQGAIALQLVFSGHWPKSNTQAFWDLLGAKGVEVAVGEFCGVDNLSILAKDPETQKGIARVPLAPKEFKPSDPRIHKRFSAAASPFIGITPLMAPNKREHTSSQLQWPDATHLSQEQLVWAAGLDIRFNSFLDSFEDELAI